MIVIKGFLLFVMIFFGVSQDCNSSQLIEQQKNGCYFTFTYSGTNCTQLKLKSCRYRACMFQFYFSCLFDKEAQNNDIRSCTYACCDDVLYNQPSSLNWIERCHQRDRSNHIFSETLGFLFNFGALTIIMYYYTQINICKQPNIGSFFFFPYLRILFLMVYTRKKIKEYCSRVRYSNIPLVQERQFQEKSSVNKSSDIHFQINQVSEQSKVWRKNPSQKNITNRLCSICRKPKQSIQLQCGHLLHRQCFIQQFKSNKGCNLCLQTNFNQIRIFCQRCFKYYYLFRIEQNSELSILSDGQLCSHCSKIVD